MAFTAQLKEQKRELLRKKKKKGKQIVYEIVRQREWYLHVGIFFIKESSSCATKWIIYKQQIITSLSYLQITSSFQLAGKEGILPEAQSLFIKLL